MSHVQGLEVYKSIAEVMGELAKEGISKDRKNQQQGFQYRGIDDCYNALAPLLAKANLCILPRITSKEVVERINAKGTALFYTTVAAEFDIVSAVDGSRHTVSSYGEAMDSGDKSIGKAMSYAYKAMAFMAFAIPTEGDNDPDVNAHEVKPRQQAAKSGAQSAKPAQGTQGAAPPKEMATQDQLAKISDLILAINNRDPGRTEADILKEISLFPGNNGDIWLTPDTLEKKCTRGYAGIIIGKAEDMLKPQ